MNLYATLNPLIKPIRDKAIPQRQSSTKKPDPAISLLQICRHADELIQIHSLLLKTSLIREKHAFGRLLLSFASSDEPKTVIYARKLFDTIDFPRNSFIFNTMIRAYLNRGHPREALLVYSQMLCEDFVYPDDFTFTFVFAACSKLSAVSEGKQAHAQMVKSPIRFGTHSWNSLMDFYVKIGEMGLVGRLLFDEIENPDVVSWNCLLDGYVKSGELENARKMFDEMSRRDIVSWTIMLVGYANAGLLSEASRLFDEMPEKNMVSWSAMISGYVNAGHCKEALDLFKDMQVAKVKTDKITMTSLLSACASLGAIEQGRWIHAYIDKNGIEVDAHLSTALVDMYSKCGRIDHALTIFQESPNKKVFLWNALLGGLAMHSRGKEVLELFSEMLADGTKPNEITFICVLSACSHSGLVDDGLRVFHSMGKDYNVAPTIEHYGCIVDLLGRAGLLQDARDVIERMPMKADGNVWRALLGACRLHGHFELGEQVGSILIELEPLNDGNYVLLSNIYAIHNRWEDVGKLRKIMKARGVRKRPGCSSIELHGSIHEFIASDRSHPQSRKIYELLDEMSSYLSEVGYEF
ncbi:Pentatricopeptide repeat [Macleaya cordata]|uniref:Pentatricopeptide repeat n=1 Tax=Macleaya cordata TaxID=56857 RepID=A0A200R222_MACCD|nr:Pentatricopeptide repeat [Macleaya cordata]